MPIFEYKCNKCGSKFELLRSASDDSGIICPNCGAGDIVKIFSAFASSSSGVSNSYCRSSSGFT
ncbi:MAG: hypothetical protein B6D58_03505 [candidate division Zixibacteria bacterium 4484_95]|nr:MAG: hypothetical protein B6D58_03505 [candidate division Zixibacteria bacterium 4484_95]RKX18894.1 MAG: zinc ribbon domain-containing protein [candidate division Zixibacteria bacterium]